MTNHCAEEPLADWEKELLMPDKDAVVHMYPAEGMTACDTKLDDGRIHLITGNLAGVSCSECRIKTLTYVNKQLNEDLAKKKEELRVSQQAYTAQHCEIINLRRRHGQDAQQNRQLRDDLEYVIRRSGITPPNSRYESPRYYPVERYPY